MNLHHILSSLPSRPLTFQLRRDARELAAGRKQRQIPDEFPQFNLFLGTAVVVFGALQSHFTA